MWRPKVTALRRSYDKIEIVSTAFPGFLWKKLPIKQLRRKCHSCDIQEIDNPYYHSRIILVCTAKGRALKLLKQAERCLLGYAVTVAEVAADAHASSEDRARANHLASIETVSKRRAVRGYVDIQFDESKDPPPGIISGPTIYYEHASSTVAFKSYCRREKAAYGQFKTQAVTRFEWTLKSSAIKTHLGGNQIDDLLNANLRTFVHKHMKLERVDYAAVGKLLAPKVARPHKWPANDPDYWARLAAYRLLRFYWYKEIDKCPKCSADATCGRHQLALRVWQQSPAHIRGFLHRQRTGVRVRKLGRPRKRRRQARPDITLYQISRCFY
jgi:hypothetical protein